MPFTLQKLTRAVILAIGIASAPLAQAQTGTPYQFELLVPDYDDYDDYDEWMSAPIEQATPLDGYLTRQATTLNGLRVAQVLEPALIRLLESGELTSEQIKELERFNEALMQQPGGVGAALEQLAGSQNANLAAATQNITQQLGSQLLSTLRALPTNDDAHVWVQGLGQDGRLDKQGGSAGLKYANRGLLTGAAWALEHAWRIGVMGAKSTSRLDAQRFSADLDSWHLGGYAVHQDGPLGLRLGAIYSRHAGQNKRSVQLLDNKQQLKGDYKAQSQTLFSEVGYQLGSADLSIEPFGGLGYQRYHRDRFQEKGGLAALNVGSQTQQNLNSTLGLRLASQYRFDNQVRLIPHISADWKRLYGKVDSRVRQSYRYMPFAIDDFTLVGASLDRNSLNWQAGLDLALSPQHTVGLAYQGEAGTNSHSQGLMGQWQMRF